MDRTVHDKMLEIFPEAQFKISWGLESVSDEWSAVDLTVYRRDINVVHLDNDHQALRDAADALVRESTLPDGAVRLFEEELLLDFDPITKTESLGVAIFYR